MASGLQTRFLSIHDVAFGSDPAQCRPAEKRPRVIVAEDDAELRRLIVISLEQDGYDVVDVGSGLELYDEVRRIHRAGGMPELILSDIRMPGLSGLMLLRLMRHWGWRCPIILVTAFGSEETLNEAFELQATAVLSKPVDMDDLRTAVMCFVWPSVDSRGELR